MANRGYTDIIRELQQISNNHSLGNPDEHDMHVMAEALAWGYSSARTCFILESYLRQADDLAALCSRIIASWDGKNFLSGALYVAQRFFDAPYGETPELL